MIFTLLTAVALIIIIRIIYDVVSEMRSVVPIPESIPHLPFTPLIGNTQADPLDFNQTLNTLSNLAEITKFKVFHREFVVCSDPKYSLTILNDTETYIRGRWPWDGDIQIFGSPILFAIDGEIWRQRRKLLNPCFSGTELRKFYPKLLDIVIPSAISRLNTIALPANSDPIAMAQSAGASDSTSTQKSPGIPEKLEMDDFFVRLTLDVICLFLFGRNFRFVEHKESPEDATILKWFQGLPLELTIYHLFPGSKWLPLPSRVSFNYNRYVSHAHIQKWIRKRRIALKSSSHSSNDDIVFEHNILDKLIPTNLSDKEIIAEILGLLFAGHDTTAHTMAWVLYYLEKIPGLKQQLVNEINEHVPGKVTSFDDTQHLNVLKATINETLRIAPPAGSHPVDTTKRVQLPDGTFLEKGATIIVNTYSILRHKNVWENPNQFDVSRWLTKNSSDPHSLSEKTTPSENTTLSSTTPTSSSTTSTSSSTSYYFPFLTGPHVCIGKQLALSEMYMVLTTLLKEFDFIFHDPKLTLAPRTSFTSRPEYGKCLFYVKKKN